MKHELAKIEDIKLAQVRIEKTVRKTPLQFNERLSKLFQTNLWLKREDLQEVRSFKIRGAYNKICSLNPKEQKKEWYARVQVIMLKVLLNHVTY